MTKRAILFLLLLCAPGWSRAPDSSPRLIVLLIGDQVRADYLERFHSQLGPEGLRRFRDEGTYYTEAARDDAVTKTSPGHVLFGSGLYASQSGIVNNDWFDTVSGKTVSAAELIPGGTRTQLRWFVGTSLAQRLHQAFPRSHMIGVSLKDRGALLLGGPDQNEVYWCDEKSRAWISYGPAPLWLKPFPPPDELKNADDVTEQVAERAMDEWQLGQDASTTDVLTVSFSQVDLVGHKYGPDSEEIRQAVLTLDRDVALLMKHVQSRVGPNVLWVFSADHGVTPLPSVSKAHGLDAGRVIFIKSFLPHSGWIRKTTPPYIYLDDKAFKTPADRSHAVAVMKTDLSQMTGVQSVYTADDLAAGRAPQAILHSYFPPRPGEGRRCGDLWVVLKPKYIFADALTGTTHGQPTPDDQRVPLGFYGAGIAVQVSSAPVSPVQVVPTLLKWLNIPASDLAAPLNINDR